MHLRKNDKVVVLSGKAKGETGTVLSVDRESGRAVVERVNMIKKHSKANPKKGIQAGIIEREAALDASNLMVVCPQCGKPTRASVAVLDDGRRVRRCRLCAAQIDK